MAILATSITYSIYNTITTIHTNKLLKYILINLKGLTYTSKILGAP